MNTLRALACLLCFAFAAGPALAGDAGARQKPAPTPGVELAALVSQVTGIAISPLLGVSAVGAYQYFKADTPEERARLPWFAQPPVWITGLVIVLACALKDGLGATLPPGWKKPFDLAELAENKLSALVATGAVLPLIVSAAIRMLGDAPDAGLASGAYSGLAMLPLADLDTTWYLKPLLIPVAIVVFAIVFIASNAINVLIILSPWGGVDAVLKAARTALLGLVVATGFIDPVVGAVFSGVIIIFAYFISGWAFRLTLFGTVFTWDFLTLRRHRFAPSESGNRVFLARRVDDAPIRTYGRLRRSNAGVLELAYRPWLIFPERVVNLPERGLAVGRGLFWPTVELEEPETRTERTLLTLPPRYKGHESRFASAAGIREIREVGLLRGWQAFRDIVGRRKRPALEQPR